MRHAGRSTARLQAALDLALISFACLYFEMIVVRWLASDVRVFAYLKNLPLLAAFLGLGLGCIRGGERLFGFFPLLCLFFASLVAFAGPLDLVHLYFPQQDSWAWNDANFQEQAWPTTLLAAKFFAVVLALFFLVVVLFTALGERLGTLFDALPPTRAYTINLLASLAGIWAFAALSWLGWPPAGWFALGFLVLLRFVLPSASARRGEQVAPPWPPPPGGEYDPPGGVVASALGSSVVTGDARPGGGVTPGPSAARGDGRVAGFSPARGDSVAGLSSARNAGVADLSPPSGGGAGGGRAQSPAWSRRRRQERRAVAWAGSLVALIALGATLLVVALAPGATRWSPYYRIDLAPYEVANTSGGRDSAGYKLTVNHDYHQNALNLSDAFIRAHPGPALEAPRTAYDLPYAFAHPRRVLIVGAGMGNDVAAALRHGAEQVDAVEIDPAILTLGRELHPESPYLSPRVRLVNEDARAFLARTDAEYDLIVFGLLDSHTLLSSMSSLRLDSYVYTLESLAQARTRLAPDGTLALSFAASLGEWGWLAGRLFQMIAATFGEEPLALDLGYDASTLYVLGPGVRDRLAADPSLAAREVDPAPLREPVPPATDDWPFLYLRDRGVPLLPYGAVLVFLLLGGSALVGLALRERPGVAASGAMQRVPANGLSSEQSNASGIARAGVQADTGTRIRPHPDPLPLGEGTSPPPRALDLPMFLLGAGFMLVEVKSISQVSLLLGSTWQVTALIISAILLLALVGNLLVAWWRPTHVGPGYVLLVLALIVDYLQPLRALGGQDALVRAGLGSLLPVLPLLFAGMVFATLFSRAPAPRRAFGFNLLGALAGGLLEYASMALGFKALGLLALVLYVGSWAALRGAPWLAPARRARAQIRSVVWRPPRPLRGAPRPRRRVPAGGRTRVVLAPHEELEK